MSDGPILVTGAAGFVGFHLARRLLAAGLEVIGVDQFSSYYDVRLKEARFSQLELMPRFSGERADLSVSPTVASLFQRHRPSRVVHLAAQPGVRHAIAEPHPYVESNVVAFLNILEGCRHCGVGHLVYASSSSVYGANSKVPFCERDGADHPVSLYGATKRSNELMAHSYSHLFGLPTTGLRFFTVYGPWGRPDMAVYAFTTAILDGMPIHVANAGRIWRDFTYIDDIIEGVFRVMEKPPGAQAASDLRMPSPADSSAPYRVYNIGNGKPEELNRLIRLIEIALGREARRIDAPMPPGDIVRSHADTTALSREIDYVPSTPLDVGVRRFVDWYLDYHAQSKQRDRKRMELVGHC